MINKTNFAQTKAAFEAWWRHEDIGRPIMCIRAIRERPSGPLEPWVQYKDFEDLHIGLDYHMVNARNYFRQRDFMAEGYPCVDFNIGPGSVATYIGSEPIFKADTVWYTECIDDITAYPSFTYDPENYWWKKHLSVIKAAREAAGEDFFINIPDLIENIDIVAALRGPQNTCYDLMDWPEHVGRLIKSVDDIYFTYYDAIYDVIKLPDPEKPGGWISSYTAFRILGEGKTAKVQCDFCAMLSPEQFRHFIVPSLTKQCRQLNHSLYHLDGRDCVKHLDALLGVEELQGIQWTPGAGQPDAASEQWFPIFDRVKAAGKSMFVDVYDGGPEDWANATRKFVKRYGPAGVYMLYPDMTREQAEAVMRAGEGTSGQWPVVSSQ